MNTTSIIESRRGPLLVGMVMSKPPIRQVVEFADAHKEVYLPIVGGGTDRLNSFGEWAKCNAIADDLHEGNISALNPHLNELTALHAMLHYVLPIYDHEYYGLCHYRRMFDDYDISKEVFRDFDIMGMAREAPRRETLEEQFKMCHYPQDWDVLRQVLVEHGQFNEDVWNEWRNLRMLIYFCNIFIAKKDKFIQHATPLLEMAVDINSRIDVTGRDSYQQRAASFLSERLDSYLMYKHQKVDGWKVGEICVNVHWDWRT